MKLRIQNNSLRFRLTQMEVMQLKENGHVEDEVRFTADRALHYSVASTNALESIEVEYAADCLRVFLPGPSVLAWGGERSGINRRSQPGRGAGRKRLSLSP